MLMKVHKTNYVGFLYEYDVCLGIIVFCEKKVLIVSWYRVVYQA